MWSSPQLIPFNSTLNFSVVPILLNKAGQNEGLMAVTQYWRFTSWGGEQRPWILMERAWDRTIKKKVLSYDLFARGHLQVYSPPHYIWKGHTCIIPKCSFSTSGGNKAYIESLMFFALSSSTISDFMDKVHWRRSRKRPFFNPQWGNLHNYGMQQIIQEHRLRRRKG